MAKKPEGVLLKLAIININQVTGHTKRLMREQGLNSIFGRASDNGDGNLRIDFGSTKPNFIIVAPEDVVIIGMTAGIMTALNRLTQPTAPREADLD